MKKTRIAAVLAVALATSLAAQSAFAWHHHRHGGARVTFGFNFGIPIGAYPYSYRPYYSPYYYPAYYPPVVIQQQAPVYVEQNPQPTPSAQPSAPAGYWYYCADARAYYPYVTECPAGWQRVAPQPG